MKNSIKLLVAGTMVSTAMFSFKSNETTSYTLQKSSSELNWKGDFVADGHAHNGTVGLTEGTIIFKGDVFESGNFTIDLNSLKSELTGDNAEHLKGSLLGEYLFNSLKATVELSSMTDKLISGKIKFAGKEVLFSAPTTTLKKEDNIDVSSKFNVDFSSANLPGMMPSLDDESKTKYINPIVSFDLKLSLKK
jgi:archaellin